MPGAIAVDHVDHLLNLLLVVIVTVLLHNCAQLLGRQEAGIAPVQYIKDHFKLRQCFRHYLKHDFKNVCKENQQQQKCLYKNNQKFMFFFFRIN